MSFETAGTFSPSIRPIGPGGKRLSSAVGLVQFLESEAKKLGTTTDALAAMTAEEQLDFVEKYFSNRRPLNSLCNVYFNVFAPICVGKSPDFVAYAGGSAAYKANAPSGPGSGMDKDASGHIECRDVCNQITPVLARAGDKRIAVDCKYSPKRKSNLLLLGGAAAALAGFAYWRGWIG